MIDRIGIELEGAWNKNDYLPDLTKDYSVKFPELSPDTYYTGEAVSPALRVYEVKKWVEKCVPTLINDTCGLHVHVSLKNLADYSKLMSPDFERHFFSKMSDFGAKMKYQSNHLYWDRLKGSNPFCARDFKPEEQVLRTDKRGPRYSQLNFCYSLHRTIECRLFPATTDVGEIMSCVNAFVESIESYLELPEIKNKELDKTYEITENDLIELIKQGQMKYGTPVVKIKKPFGYFDWNTAAVAVHNTFNPTDL